MIHSPHSKPFPRPLPPRIKVSYPKHVTIALGILTQYGVAMAADTLESWGTGFKKTQTPKILTGNCGQDGGCIAVSGAGDGHFLDGIKQEVVHLFMDYSRAGTVQSEFEKALKELVRKHYTRYVAPIPYDDRPSFQLLIGTSYKRRYSLWVTSKTETHPVFGHDAIGAGSNHAKSVIDRLTSPWVNINVARLVAAYVVFSTKGIEGCGGDTNLVTVNGDTATHLDRALIQEMEGLFRAYDGVEARAFHHSIGYPSEDPIGDLAKLNSWIDSLRNDFTKLAAKLP